MSNPDEFVPYPNSDGSSVILPSCCSVVPILYAGDFHSESVDVSLLLLKEWGSVASPGFSDPEGVVVFLPQAGQLFKVTFGSDGHEEIK